MRESKIQVGDRLRVREWDDMAAEFGVRDSRSVTNGYVIPCEFAFTEKMKYMCGRPFTVADLRGNRFISKEKIELESGRYGGWNISADMLEPIEEETVMEAADFDGLFALLSGS